MSIFNNILAGASGQGAAAGFKIERSLRFNSSDTSYLNRTPSSASNRKTFTISLWLKRSAIPTSNVGIISAGTSGNGDFVRFSDESPNNLRIYGDGSYDLRTNAVFRDPSAWYHFVIAYDTTQPTESDRIKLYINGEQITSFANATYPSLNADTRWNSTERHDIGRVQSTTYFDGYLAEVNFIDGQALDCTAFGEFDTYGVWQPKAFTGEYSSSTVYTNIATISSGGAAGAHPLSQGFNGDLGNRFEGDTTNAYVDIPYEANVTSGSVQAYAAVSSGQGMVITLFDGSTQVDQGSSDPTGLQWHAPTTYSGPITKIRISRTSRAPEFNAIRVNGQILQDNLGANSYHLDFSDNSTNAALGNDSSSGNSNTWTPNNISAAASVLSAPRGSNYDTESSTYTEYGTVSQASSLTLPMSNPSHYEGAALRLNRGGFNVDATNSASTEFFMACWINFDDHTAGNQIGVDIGGAYKYFEVRSDGNIKIRHVSPGTSATSTGSPLSTGTWQHIALSRSGNTLTGFVDGTAVVTASCGNATNTVSANEQFNFFALSGTSYNVAGYMLDAVVYVGAGRTANYTVPSSPLITSSGGINDVAGMSASNRVYASNLISVGSGSEGIDSLIDTPTNYTADSGNNGGNYCVMNPLDMKSNVATQNGNMEVKNASAGWSGIRGTLGVSSGKWYYELKTETASIFAGIATAGVDINANAPQDTTSVMDDGALIYCDDGKYLLDQGGSSNRVSYGSALANGDILGVAIDLDGNTVQFFKNNSALGSINISSSPLASNTVFPYYISYYPSTSAFFNFGQRPFAYTPPTGYKSLCTTNLPEPTIAAGNQYFNVKKWLGNGNVSNIATDFSPDFVWIKKRSGTSDHVIQDTVRGTTKRLYANDGSGEDTLTNNVTAFDPTGFSVGNANDVNQLNQTYVGWIWDAGSSTVTNTDGSITASVRANPLAGFSIVTYTGTEGGTFGHGLNAAPEMVIVKRRNSSAAWTVWHKAIPNTQYLMLNNSTSPQTFNVWGNTSPTSSVVSVSGDSYTGNNGDNYVAYCFTSIEGYSSIGSYAGNGTSDNTFVYTGFKPKFILFRNTSFHGGDWILLDTERRPNGAAGGSLAANVSNAEDSYYSSSQVNFDFLSNGFKIRHHGAPGGDNGRTYLFATFAEHPFKTARAY